MFSLEDTITIARSPQDVFTFFADLNNIPKWQSDVVTSKVITPGPTRVGTRFTEEVKIGPSRATANCEVTEFLPNQKLAFSADSPAIHYHGAFQVKPSGMGTRLDIFVTVELKGAWKLMQPILKGESKAGIRKELTTLKEILEKQ